MAVPDNRFSYLYRQYIDKKCSAEEMREFFILAQDPIHQEMLEMLADTHLESIQQPAALPDIDWEHMYRNILQQAGPFPQPIMDQNSRKKGRIVPLFALWRVAAAVIIIILCAGGYFLISKRQKSSPAEDTIAKAVKNDVLPGGNKAVLTLASGQAIILDSARNGMLAQQGNATVIKQNNGQLAYTTANEKPTEVLYNTLATPRGGQYQLVLPDGSKVWLNAASSIRYPTSFNGKQRAVEITGEAYFEVAKNEKMPFLVKMVSASGDKGEVKVLGTHFNVNAYDDEEMVRTTLLEGSVLMKKDAAMAILKPGQQSRLAKSGKMDVMDKADVEEAVAWKNGKHAFNNADIETIMRQAARWYDIEVVYKAKIEDHYTVNLPRNVPVSQLFHFLELSGGVHFAIEGKKIIVTN